MERTAGTVVVPAHSLIQVIEAVHSAVGSAAQRVEDGGVDAIPIQEIHAGPAATAEPDHVSRIIDIPDINLSVGPGITYVGVAIAAFAEAELVERGIKIVA